MIDVYEGDTFKIILQRYTDPKRLNAARNAAIYLGKTDRDNIKRPLKILRQGHVPEIFRGEFAEFEFIDVSKEVYDHLVTYTTRNMRVAGGNRALTSDSYTMPSDKMKDPERVKQNIEKSMTAYKDNLDSGETPQVARTAMPIAAKLNPFVLQFNFVTLMQAVFPQRIWEKGAQGNTVKVVQGMYELVRRQDPELWDLVYQLYGTPAIEWRIARRKIEKLTVEQLIQRLRDYGEEHNAFEAIRALFGEQKSMWD